MRKIAAILLIAIFLFNLGGYRIIIPLLQERADNRLDLLIDNNEYDESELIEISVTLDMPYQQRFTDFERHYGQVEIDGKSYTYVKKKIEGDVVIFKCIANSSKQHLRSFQNDMARANSSGDMDQPGQSKQPFSFLKNVLSDFDDQNQFNQSLSSILLVNNYNPFYNLYFPQVSHTTLHQPPRC